jgi:hypothetical protein
MKRKISIAIITSLIVLTLLVTCSNVSADGIATFRGRVRPIGTTGTVEVIGGGEQVSAPIGPLGFYFVTVGVKFEGASYTVTAHANRGSQSKTVENVQSGSSYVINFNFGVVVSIPQSIEVNKQQSSISIFLTLLNMIAQSKNNNPINNV